MTFAELRADAVILACAISAGIHAALAPAHFDEGTPAGLGFVAAAVSLAVIGVVLTRQPTSVGAGVAAAFVFAGLIASYVLATTTGMPVLHPEPEPIDGLAVATKAIEALGLLASWRLVSPRLVPVLHLPKAKGTPT